MRHRSGHGRCRVNNGVRKDETMTVGMYERVNEKWYWRPLERVGGNKKSSKNDRKGRGSRVGRKEGCCSIKRMERNGGYRGGQDDESLSMSGDRKLRVRC